MSRCSEHLGSNMAGRTGGETLFVAVFSRVTALSVHLSGETMRGEAEMQLSDMGRTARPGIFRSSIAHRPNSRSRVFSGCNSRLNFRIRSPSSALGSETCNGEAHQICWILN